MRYIAGLALVFAVGCTAPLERLIGPSFEAEERAYRAVWEGAYGMERESRPPTSWVADCANPEPRSECIIADLSPDGDVTIVWREGRQGAPRISGTFWPELLASWRVVLLTGRRGDPDADLVRSAREALGREGL
jgi:hypothetical protein